PNGVMAMSQEQRPRTGTRRSGGSFAARMTATDHNDVVFAHRQVLRPSLRGGKQSMFHVKHYLPMQKSLNTTSSSSSKSTRPVMRPTARKASRKSSAVSSGSSGFVA